MAQSDAVLGSTDRAARVVERYGPHAASLIDEIGGVIVTSILADLSLRVDDRRWAPNWRLWWRPCGRRCQGAGPGERHEEHPPRHGPHRRGGAEACAHLERSVRTGAECRYDPEPASALRWDISP
jgi:hypothetical protein